MTLWSDAKSYIQIAFGVTKWVNINGFEKAGLLLDVQEGNATLPFPQIGPTLRKIRQEPALRREEAGFLRSR